METHPSTSPTSTLWAVSAGPMYLRLVSPSVCARYTVRHIASQDVVGRTNVLKVGVSQCVC